MIKLTPAQQRLIVAAQHRRALENERELNAWREANGTQPESSQFAGEIYRPPVSKGCAVIVMQIAFTWIAIIALVAVLIKLF